MRIPSNFRLGPKQGREGGQKQRTEGPHQQRSGGSDLPKRKEKLPPVRALTVNREV